MSSFPILIPIKNTFTSLVFILRTIADDFHIDSLCDRGSSGRSTHEGKSSKHTSSKQEKKGGEEDVK